MQKSLTVIALLLIGVAGGAQAKVYKWVDDNGRIHFGDKIPAQYTNSPHEKLSNSGRIIESVGRAKSKDELRVERIAKEAEEKRLTEERQAKLEQARQDQILLDTFASERDINMMRDDRLSAIDSYLLMTESYNAQLRSQLEKTQNRIDALVKQKKAAPESLLKQIEGIQSQLDKNNESVEQKNREKTEINDQFTRYTARFKELRARRYGN